MLLLLLLLFGLLLGWDQSEKYVKIYIHDMEGAKNEHIHTELDTR